MKILVIDGMGGGVGKSIIEQIRNDLAGVEITAVGTNSIATSAMLKAGADYGATGENAVIYNCKKADYVVGVMGIMLANSMHGEISPRMAEAVASCDAHKILIPIDKCNVTVIGTRESSLQAYINEITITITKTIPTTIPQPITKPVAKSITRSITKNIN